MAHAIRAYRDRPGLPVSEMFRHGIPVASKKRFVVPKNETQRRYLEAISSHDLVIGIGPAGTGKTYLAMAMAVASLLKQEVSRIILVRPAVEAGERLGFLPGDLVEKINPYLRPLRRPVRHDGDGAGGPCLIERGSIEVAPLAFMRGRTLNDSFIILDEAQNTTREQMKMFLTRLGFNSKAVVTGDVTQVDLRPRRDRGSSKSSACWPRSRRSHLSISPRRTWSVTASSNGSSRPMNKQTPARLDISVIDRQRRAKISRSGARSRPQGPDAGRDPRRGRVRPLRGRPADARSQPDVSGADRATDVLAFSFREGEQGAARRTSSETW